MPGKRVADLTPLQSDLGARINDDALATLEDLLQRQHLIDEKPVRILEVFINDFSVMQV